MIYKIFEDDGVTVKNVISASPEFMLSNHSQSRYEKVETDVMVDLLVELPNLKIRKNDEVNKARLKANRGSFVHAGKEFSCDELSRSDIDGITSFVTLMGGLPPEWPGAWKAIDNTYTPIPDVNAWKAFVGSMVAKGNTNFIKAQTLKAAITAATTVEEVMEINW